MIFNDKNTEKEHHQWGGGGGGFGPKNLKKKLEAKNKMN
jgi:hypothetical protein